jgi:hypothetical protein
MSAKIVYVDNPFKPFERREVMGVGLLRDFVPESQYPIVCRVNDDYVLRAEWDVVELKSGDLCAFITAPQGGDSGSQILQVVLMIGLAVFAPWAAGQMGFAAGTTGFTLATAGIQIIGSMLIGALAPTPSNPTSQAIAQPSPTYSLQGQGNRARLEQPIPVVYGRHIVFPDLGCQAYALYEDDDQFLYQLFVVGQGEYELEAIKIEDTPISNFEEIDYEIIPPNGSVTLFETNIVSSAEVSGQEMLTPIDFDNEEWAYIGGFVAVPAGYEADEIGIDIAFSRGLFYAENDGSLSNLTVTWRVETLLIDDFGNSLSNWTELATETLTAAQSKVLRRSYAYAISEGRYMVRVARTSVKNDDNRASSDINWIGLRAALPGKSVQANSATMIAMKMRATNNLSSANSRRVNVVANRKLNTWNPTDGWSVDTVSTRSLIWALADAVRNSDYSIGLTDSRINLEEMYELDQVYQARFDYFDGIFDSRITVWEALQKIARAGRATPIMVGGILTVVRDSAQTIPVAMFTNRNIAAGSFSMTLTTETDDRPDSLIGEYFDNRIWSYRRVTGFIEETDMERPAKVPMFGITGELQAKREAMAMAATNKYRPWTFSFETEMEGFIPRYGDFAAIANDLTAFGESGDVLEYDSDTRTVTLSEPVTYNPGGSYISFTRKNASMSGPYSVINVSEDVQVILGSDPDFDINAGFDYERTKYVYGPLANHYQGVRIIGIDPRSMERVQITAINEDARVHTADNAYFGEGASSGAPSSTQFYLGSTNSGVNLYDVAGRPANADDYTFVIGDGVVIGAPSTSGYAINTGVFPVGSTVTLIVTNGYAVGRGGAGGIGADGTADFNGFFPPGPGGDGGSAINIDFPLTIENGGVIGAGGGGGQGGGVLEPAEETPAGSGGGGGAGRIGGTGGAGGVNIPRGYISQRGNNGTLTSGGSPGFNVSAVDGGTGYHGGGLAQPGEGPLGGAAGYSLVSTNPSMLVDVTGTAPIGAYLNVRQIIAEVKAWRDACDILPGIDQLGAYQDFVVALKDSGAWTLLDWLMLYASHDDQSSRINRVLPGTFDATKINSPTFTTFEGWVASGANQIDVPFDIAASGIQASQNSVTAITCVIANTGQSNGNALASQGGTQSIILRPYNTSSQFLVRAHSGTANDTVSSITSAKGFWALVRSSSTGYSVFNQTTKTNFTRTSSAPNYTSIRTPAAGSPPWTIALSAMGASMSDAQILSIRTAYNAYMVAMGKSPLP